MRGEALVLMESWWNHLEEDLSRHGEAVGNDGLFIWGLALPAVQLQAAAPGQQTLSVHLRRGHAGELASCGERRGRGRKRKQRKDNFIGDCSPENLRAGGVNAATCQVRVVGGLDEVVG